MEGLFALPKVSSCMHCSESEQTAEDIDDSFKCPQCQAREISMPNHAQSLVWRIHNWDFSASLGWHWLTPCVEHRARTFHVAFMPVRAQAKRRFSACDRRGEVMWWNLMECIVCRTARVHSCASIHFYIFYSCYLSSQAAPPGGRLCRKSGLWRWFQHLDVRSKGRGRLEARRSPKTKPYVSYLISWQQLVYGFGVCSLR